VFPFPDRGDALNIVVVSSDILPMGDGVRDGPVEMRRRRDRIPLGAVGLAAVALCAASVTGVAHGARVRAQGGLGPPVPEPAPSTQLPPSDVLGRFAVLRGAVSPADQLPPLSTFGFAFSESLATYNPAASRLVATLPSGGQLFLIIGVSQKIRAPPAAIVPEKYRKTIKKQIRALAPFSAAPTYCLTPLGDTGPLVGPRAGCEPFSLQPNGFAITSTQDNLVGRPGRTLVGLVPDGVASVQLDFPHRASLSAAVAQNIYVAHGDFSYLDSLEQQLERASRGRASPRLRLALGRRISDAATPSRVRWLDATGQVSDSFPRPSGLAAARESETLSGYTVIGP
jgi:hypothetical protein